MSTSRFFALTALLALAAAVVVEPARAEAPGSGLGLAISQRIVKNHGGTITVRSTVGEGTEFVIRLPAVPEARALPADGTPNPDAIFGTTGPILELPPKGDSLPPGLPAPVLVPVPASVSVALQASVPESAPAQPAPPAPGVAKKA